MHDHPIGGPPARPGSLEAEPDVQRAVLLALLPAPCDEGESVSAIAVATRQSPAAVRAAVELLVWIGLLYQSGPSIRAAGAAIHLTELWPVPR